MIIDLFHLEHFRRSRVISGVKMSFGLNQHPYIEKGVHEHKHTLLSNSFSCH